jgi:hypothetical protein
MTSPRQFSDDELEGYYMGTVPRPAIAAFEARLTEQQKCLQMERDTDRYIDAIRKVAASESAARRSASRTPASGYRNFVLVGR